MRRLVSCCCCWRCYYKRCDICGLWDVIEGRYINAQLWSQRAVSFIIGCVTVSESISAVYPFVAFTICLYHCISLCRFSVSAYAFACLPLFYLLCLSLLSSDFTSEDDRVADRISHWATMRIYPDGLRKPPAELHAVDSGQAIGSSGKDLKDLDRGWTRHQRQTQEDGRKQIR